MLLLWIFNIHKVGTGGVQDASEIDVNSKLCSTKFLTALEASRRGIESNPFALPNHLCQMKFLKIPTDLEICSDVRLGTSRITRSFQNMVLQDGPEPYSSKL